MEVIKRGDKKANLWVVHQKPFSHEFGFYPKVAVLFFSPSLKFFIKKNTKITNFLDF